MFLYLRHGDWSYLDGFLSWVVSSIPLISYIISLFSFLNSSKVSLQPDTIQEIIQVVTFAFTNLAIRILVFAISLIIPGRKSLNRQNFKI